MNKTLALCMIVKNEEDTLPTCLNSVETIFDEIIIVDTGSTDKTIEIAKKYTDSVYNFEWKDNFSAARNFAFSKSISDYLMWLDADDIILPEDANKLKKLKNKLDGKIREILALYNVGFDEYGKVTLSYYRERIFLRDAGFLWSGYVHETIPIVKDCIYADFAITHHKIHPSETERNLKIYEKIKSKGEILDARNSFYYARELYYNNKKDKAIQEFTKFLSCSDGYVENKINACSLLADCLKSKGESPLPILFKSFEFGLPRAEICCDIGKYFFENHSYAEAIYWYEEALSKKPIPFNGGFVFPDCYDFIPYIQLCVLYYKIGNIEQAILFNEKASAIKPYDKAVLFNKNFFDNLKK